MATALTLAPAAASTPAPNAPAAGTTSRIAPGESALLVHPKYTIVALPKGVEVVNGGQKTLALKSSDEDEDEVVIKPGKSAILASNNYDIAIKE
ncbi:hypothetical protein APHAL10511_000038 [Amanita phalloides]|nr:hypothetical protein APHAL10511_000038 [Amanita phalloides]